MKHVQKKTLTSNSFLNKLLLLHPDLDTKFDYTYDGVVRCNVTINFLNVLIAENVDRRLTDEEFDRILFDYFDLPNNINQLSDTIKIYLIEIDKFIN